jgi:DNA-binding winged helix-turn-helix (wHTH) protein
MEVLICLAHHPGETLPKEQLLKTVWPDTFVTDDVLVRAVSEIRHGFDDDARESKFIQTIPKRGYRLIAPVVIVNGSAGFASEISKTADEVKQPTFARRGLRIRVVIGITAAIALLAVLALTSPGVWRKLASSIHAGRLAHRFKTIPICPLSGQRLFH